MAMEGVVNEVGRTGRSIQGAQEAMWQWMGPIPLPTQALAEVFGFMSRAERARLALVSGQAADAIIPGVNAERRKVGSSFSKPHYHT